MMTSLVILQSKPLIFIILCRSRVARLVDGYQEGGTYTMQVDSNMLNQGVYTVTLVYRARGDVKMKSIKIVRGW